MNTDQAKLSERIERGEVGYVEHSKTRSIYFVYNVATHSETGEKLVLYVNITGLWCRPLNQFDDEVRVDGKTVPRFVERKLT